MSKPRLLFVSPVVPKLSGTGIAMRAGTQLRELASLFTVTLGIVLDGQRSEDAQAELPKELRELCAEVIVSSEPPLLTRLTLLFPNSRSRRIAQAVLRVPPHFQRRAAIRALAGKLKGKHFDVVHCFRLITGSLPRALVSKGGVYSRSVLDLDDYESRAKLRYAAKLLRNLGPLQWLAGRFEVLMWAALENRTVPRFDDVYVCSTMDRELLQARFSSKARFVTVPNVVSGWNPSPRSPADPFIFLFVGSLSYPPNRDAVMFFCRNILPQLRRMAAAPFRVQIVGQKPDEELRKLNNGSDIEVVGSVPDVSPFYLAAGAAIVPLRAGGGTRIKILEAFSCAVPVVSTAVGAEGLEVEDGKNILIADAPEDFAARCSLLISDTGMRQRIGEGGLALFEQQYTQKRLGNILASAYTAAGLF